MSLASSGVRTKSLLQLEAAHQKAAMAESEIREAVAGEMEELLRDMEASYKVRASLAVHVHHSLAQRL